MQLPGGGGNKVVGALQDLETSFNVMGYWAFRCLGDEGKSSGQSFHASVELLAEPPKQGFGRQRYIACRGCRAAHFEGSTASDELSDHLIHGAARNPRTLGYLVAVERATCANK